jgi:hypothetical protein
MNGVANGVYGGDLPNQINTPWIDFSEQSTIVGWSSYTTKQIRYKVIGSTIYVYYNIDGTSNSTATTFTLPIIPKTISAATYMYAMDNAVYQVGLLAQLSATGIVVTASRYSSITGIISTWTASGRKHIQGQFFYEI